MAQDNRVYVTGHQKPDTDCIASAIGYAFYQRALGVDAVPCRLGRINLETRYLLSRFHFDTPLLLETSKVRMDEIDLAEPVSISPDETILETVRKMEDSGRSSLAVTDDENRLVGWISRSDVARLTLDNTELSNDLMKETSTEDICRTISGKILYNDPERHLNGDISILTFNARERLSNYVAEDRIIISGYNREIMSELILKGAGMLILLHSESRVIDEDVLALAREHHCPIVLSGLNSMNTTRYTYLSPPAGLIMQKKVEKIYTHELADDVSRKIAGSQIKSYPVVDSDNHLVGYLSRYHIMNYHNKRMVLVDHNEFQHSVKGIEDTTVLQVIDHHRVADFSTAKPVNFRNEIVGATSTIIATIFRENMIPFSREMAGLLLGGILSETVNLQAPTTTARDLETANILAAVADLRLDDFAREMFSMDVNAGDRMVEEMISYDMILRDINGIRTAFGRVNVSEIENYRHDMRDVQQRLQDYCSSRNMDLCLLAFVSALENGCILFRAGSKADWALEAFPNRKGEEYSFQEGILSRHSQIIPRVTEIIEKYTL